MSKILTAVVLIFIGFMVVFFVGLLVPGGFGLLVSAVICFFVGYHLGVPLDDFFEDVLHGRS